ncbi:MAG: alpha/beta fold hydrolase [Erysipelotrichaceae bacterium]|nr:alpha/beta fold hydrolase [Erysipelotrichaceae bacterium]
MISEKIVVGRGTDYPLNGILTLPDTIENKVPAVVLVHGSGASNMDEKVMKLRPFKDIAEGLAYEGVAVIRYDKRTFAHARKLRHVEPTVEMETIEDVVRAAALLRQDPRIDENRIFIVGHSMGAMLAPRIDAECGYFKGLIMMAGTPYRLEDIVVRQLKQAGNSGGFLMRKIVELESKVYAKRFDNLYTMPEEEARKKKFAGNLSLYYFREMGAKTAGDYLLESDKPVMIMQGGKDFQVLKDVDFEGFKQILKEKNNVTYKLYDELNHVFVKGIYNDITKASKEYSVPQHVDVRVIKDIAAFIHSN